MSDFERVLCNEAGSETARLSMSQVSLSDGKAPEWIPLLPAGEHLKALDGREFYNPDPQAVIDAFNEDPRDLALDWEHASELKAPKGERAPAAGWIKAMELRDGAIWGQVEWTDNGKLDVETKAYRYISPTFLYSKAKKAIDRLISAALVNRPGFDMPAIARAEPEQTQEKESMNKELLQLLGLQEGASEAEVQAAVRKTLQATTDLATEATQLRAQLKETQEELVSARNANPALDKFVPRADYDVAIARADEAEAKVAAGEKKAHEEKVEVAIAAALKAGKITPATKDFYVGTCATQEGLKQFEEFVKGAPAVGDPSNIDKDPPPGQSDKATLNEDQRKILERCGMSVEDFQKGQALTI